LTVSAAFGYLRRVSTSTKSPAELGALSREKFVDYLGSIYEHSPWIAEQAWTRRPFSSLDDLRSKLDASLRAAGPEAHLALIQAHPDLAGRLARAGRLTNESTREQQSAGLDSLAPEEAAEFDRLNRAYLDRFGFPFVICARLNDRRTILEAFRRRLRHEREEEIVTALAEIHQIAGLRLAQIVQD
jgi:2-oxo-4-hydroxy-4-carboxy-5-ureidoimidazoline decarboxylase